MPIVLRSLSLGLAVWLAIAGLAFASAAANPVEPAASDVRHQVLVMLRLPPEHARPGADYGGSYGDGMGNAARRQIVARLARTYGLKLVDGWPMPLLGVDCFVLTVPPDQSPEDVAARLSKEPAVAWSEPMNLYRAMGQAPTHNDPLFAAQPAARAWRLAELHQIATGRGVRVAVIDSKVEGAHPDLIGQVAISRDFVLVHARAAEQHGTGVAGVIAARADNGIGIAGVAPRARLMALRACWQQDPQRGKPPATLCDSLDLAKAIDFAIAHNAQVINMSLSGPPDQLLARLLDAALARRITIVGAFDRDLPGGGFPASHAGVVAVADDTWASPPAGVYSAPGHDVPTTTPGGHWSLVNGSSFAAAHVSGLFALVRERTPGSSGTLMLATTSAHGGAIDACATVSRLAPHCDCGCFQIRQTASIARR